jgi:hypothetical protein
MIEVELDDGLLLVVRQPVVSGYPAVVLICFSAAFLPFA